MREEGTIFRAANRAVIQEWRYKMLGGVRTAEDINHGLCEVWADWVCARLAGAQKEINQDGTHCAVRYRGKLYDVENHSGRGNFSGTEDELTARRKGERRWLHITK